MELEEEVFNVLAQSNVGSRFSSDKLIMKKKKKKIISWGSGDHMHNYEVPNGVKTYFDHKTAKIISRYA